MSKYKHVKGLKHQTPRLLKISSDDYINLLAGEEVNLSASELKELESKGIKLSKVGDGSSFSQKPVTKKKGDK